MADTMTRKERVLTAMRRQQPDRVPAVLRTNYPAVRISGHTVLDCFKDEDVYVRAQLDATEKLDVEIVWASGFAENIFERALGQKMIWSEIEAAAPAEPLINSPADLDALPARPNVKDNWWYRFVTSIVGKLRKAAGDDVAVVPTVVSPFRAACLLRGAENLYVDMYEDPDFVRRLVDYCVQPMTDLAEMVAEAGADACLTAAPVASRNMISRKHYLEFVHAMHEAVFADWEQRIGLPVIWHICGDWSDRLDLAAAEHASCINIADESASKLSLDRTKELVGSQVSIMGNLKCTGALLFGTPEEVEQECVEAIQRGAAGGGFLLSSDCGMSWHTPAENIKAVAMAVRTYGVYPRLAAAGSAPGGHEQGTAG